HSYQVFKLDIVEGNGPEAHDGDLVKFNYVCRRANGYFVFSTVDQFNGESKPVILPLDENQMITGLKEVLTGMRVGARSDEHSRLSAEAEERHAEAMKMAEQREEELRQQIASLKARNEQEQEVRGEHLAQPLWRQPSCEEIDEARIPPHFREISVDPFDETQDSHAHLQAFQT
ncbi:Peptidyl-prolyl cis-trans isomerase FKBP16-1, chloroplastic, partial [Mucuna pruriens]